MRQAEVEDNNYGRILTSPDYNFVFNKKTGFFARWGATYEDDPEYCPYGPELLDIEISTICSRACEFCYKSNNHIGDNMSIDTFKQILAKLPPTVTQIAFGIGDTDANPDMFSIFRATRDAGIVPNVTIQPGPMPETTANLLMHYCGAVAVSHYGLFETMDTIRQLAKYKKKDQQINVHTMLSNETYLQVKNIVTNWKYMESLGADAVVILMLKTKGERNEHTQATDLEFRYIMNKCMYSKIKFGMDSCASHRFIKYLTERTTEGDMTPEELEKMYEVIEPCEGTLFSYYINVKGEGYPCSFLEGVMEGVGVLDADDFIKDVWYNGFNEHYRRNQINTGRHCPMYQI